MSLFPAYGGGEPPAATEATATSSAAWKSNKSYEKEMAIIEQTHISSDDSSSSSSGEEETPPPKESVHQLRLEFDARSDGFYVDKKGNNSLRTVRTLTKPTRPHYKRRLPHLLDNSQMQAKHWPRSKLQRYTKVAPVPSESAPTAEELAKLQAQLMDTKVLVQREPQHLEHWLQLHRLLELNLDKANRLAVSEHQLHTLEMALGHHPSNERLLRLYTETASAAYPASEVAVRLEAMLQQSPFVFSLWSSLIMATQGTMARCNVPDVLRIYEDSMRRMHLGHTDTSSRQLDTVDTDKIMLDLFHNCVLFLRQSANNNHVFALLRLALELNFPGLTVDCLEARATDELPLIEFEELVLQSGMPLPEIWTRVERLRQAYNFLPYPQMQHSSTDAVEGGLDPQRFIFSDDVCHYIYPLKASGNRLQLLLLVVQLTKMPLVRSDCLAEKLSKRIDAQLGDSEAIEMLLAGLADRSSYALPSTDQDRDFISALLDLSRELCVTPSFMPHCLGSDLYAATIGGLLLKCSEAFHGDEDKRRLFVVLWLRFQRLQLVLHKLTGKLTEQYLKETRSRIRKLFSLEQNRHVFRFYTELAMCEFEVLERDDDPVRAFSIFRTLLAKQEEEEDYVSSPDVLHAYLIYAEMLISRNCHDQALQLLYRICNGRMCHSLDEITSREQLKLEILALDGMPQEMQLEEYFQPHRLLILLRAHCLAWNLEQRSAETNVLLDRLLAKQLSFAATRNSERRRFFREQVLEMQLVLRQLPKPEKPLPEETASLRYPAFTSKNHVAQLVEQGLQEYPRNLVFLQRWATFGTLPWHKLRARIIRTQAGILSLLHLVIAARCRFARILDHGQQQSDPQLRSHVEATVRNRVLSMFETFLPRNTNRSEIEANQYQILRRNSLYWRIYLRCLSDTRTSFERSKECLVSALDECPWDKALYMDGAIYVPQELAHLQDVMIEKQLRIYALPEELNILRGS